MDINKLFEFIEALPDSSLIINKEGAILGANAVALKTIGYSIETIRQLGVEDLVPDRFLKNHKELRASFLMSTQQRSMGQSSSRYFPTKLADGSEIMTEISIGRINLTDEEQLLLVIIIDRTEKVRMEEELKNRATIDQLTEVFSRAYFLELGEKEVERTIRYKLDLSLIYFDIDHFKNINDSYGHAIGDLVLRQIGEACRKELRDVDICGRLGGDEFVVILPETNIEKASFVSNRLRIAFQEIKIAVADETVPITSSFGVTSFCTSDKQLSDVINRADKALYNAKESGRDVVKCESQ